MMDGGSSPEAAHLSPADFLRASGRVTKIEYPTPIYNLEQIKALSRKYPELDTAVLPFAGHIIETLSAPIITDTFLTHDKRRIWRNELARAHPQARALYDSSILRKNTLAKLVNNYIPLRDFGLINDANLEEQFQMLWEKFHPKGDHPSYDTLSTPQKIVVARECRAFGRKVIDSLFQKYPLDKVVQ